MLSKIFTDGALRVSSRYLVILSLLAVGLAGNASTVREPQGGADGGGGDASGLQPISASELEDFVQRLPRILTVVLNYQEFKSLDAHQAKGTSGSLETLQSARQKMFASSGRNVFHELSQIHFKVREQCWDLHFLEKDATAFNPQPSEICFNEKTLRDKLTSANVISELLSLAVHELSHRTGANELEARAIHEEVRGALSIYGSIGAFEKAIADFPSYDFVPGLKEAKVLLYVEKEVDSMELCLNLSVLAKFGVGQIPQNGISQFRYHILQHAYASQKQLENLLGYCRKMGYMEARYNFYNQQQPKNILVSDAVQSTAHLEEVIQLDSRHGYARFGAYLDTQALQINFSEFLKNLDLVFSSVDLQR